MQILRAGDTGNLCSQATNSTRLPSGHPEGLIEAFANIYKKFAEAVNAHAEGIEVHDTEFASVREGLRGMRFIDAVVESAHSDHKWITIKR